MNVKEKWTGKDDIENTNRGSWKWMARMYSSYWQRSKPSHTSRISDFVWLALVRRIYKSKTTEELAWN